MRRDVRRRVLNSLLRLRLTVPDGVECAEQSVGGYTLYGPMRFDCGNQFGIAIRCPNGKRHAARGIIWVPDGEDWAQLAANPLQAAWQARDAVLEWVAADRHLRARLG
jgi:hypothetical protein